MTNLTIDEIISLYVNAKDKDKQITILAELTASDIETIVEVLKDNGIYQQNNIVTCKGCGRMFICEGSKRLPSYCRPCKIIRRPELKGGRR